MSIKAVGCDSGGQAGVTANANAFWKWLRDECDEPSLHRRFHLIKGDGKPATPRFAITHPDSQRKDRKAGARGEVPLLKLGSNLIKDQTANMLKRTEDGPGRITFNKAFPDKFYEELTSEVRTPRGWENPKGKRNESWDLLYYCVGLCISPYINVERIDWARAPGWAEEWDVNDLVFMPEDGRRFAERKPKERKSLAELARLING